MAVTRQQDSRSARKPQAGDRKQNTLAVQNFARGLGSEFRRITWPSRPEWIAATILTLVLVVGIGLFTFGVDQLCTWLFGLIHR